MLYDIVRKLSDGSDVEITFPDEKGQLTIASGRSKFALSTIAAIDISRTLAITVFRITHFAAQTRTAATVITGIGAVLAAGFI